MIRAIDRMLLRDLWRLRGQALAIALVIGSGVATLIMSLSTLDSLRRTQASFYENYRFADVFAALKRAPAGLRGRMAEIAGVGLVETRVIADVKIDLEGFPDPVTGRIVSIPDRGEPRLNALYLRAGRTIEPGRDDEVIASEAFAQAHHLNPGDSITAIINGRRKALTIVGLGLSPEFIYQIAPGSVMPDFARFAILWMGETPLATAYDMEGAFNDVALSLTADAHLDDVLDRLDDLLAPYGGLGAYGRADQLSHRYLSEEFKQLGRMAEIFPVIFLGVAAFLLNVVVSRLVSTQREQIAALKAFGYGDLDVGLHYAKLIVAITLTGVAVGTAGGLWLGEGLSGLYVRFYRFPFLEYELRPAIIAEAALISLATALAGAAFAVRRAARLPPAQAMRPELPMLYRATIVERLGLQRWLAQPTRMIARHVERRPVKSLLSIMGIAFAVAIMMVGNFQEDAINFMVDVQFGLAQREDLAVTFVEPASRRALHELTSLPGVEYGETFRAVPARLRFGHRSYRAAIQGMEPGGDLERLLDIRLRPVALPPEGIVLTDYLGKILGVRPGDRLRVEVLEGSQPVLDVPVAGLISQYIGVAAYMDRAALNRLMREGEAISGAWLAVDERSQAAVFEALKERPRVAGTMIRKRAIATFYETMGETILIFTFINTLLAATIAVGVVYNSARITLSERRWELATLRVLGLTRAEISYILLGELGLFTLAAIPLGFLIGRGLCAYIAENLQSDLFRVPLVVEPSTYGFAAAVVLAAAALSGLLVRRRLDRLDLVAVLKTGD
jgi:putative ABC transport system permease protein